MQLLIDTIGEATLYEWGRVRAVPLLCILYPSIRLQLRKIGKPLSGYPTGDRLNSAGHESLSRREHRFVVVSTGLTFRPCLARQTTGQSWITRYLSSFRTSGFFT